MEHVHNDVHRRGLRRKSPENKADWKQPSSQLDDPRDIEVRQRFVFVSRGCTQKSSHLFIMLTQGRSALSLAAEMGRAGVIRLLLDAGANVNSRDRNNRGCWTCLMWGSDSGHTEVVDMLLAKGCDTDVKDKVC